ncbi:hypothetical protein PCAU_0517 [Pseudomonas chlororaphis subsp. aurantiaca]|nr:hypothetical protein PCAU_0517 [Pseudomonas chlororaphis subsp. aurantiaca]
MARPISAPVHSAITEALAEPATPQSRPSTNHRLRAMLIRLVLNRIASGARAFWVPRNQPTRAMLASAAGSPSRRVWKKVRVISSSSAEGCINCKAAPLSGTPMAPSSRASPMASSRPCTRICRSAAPSARPAAWAAKPVAPMRRKPMAQARKV